MQIYSKLKADVDDNIRQNLSIGYRILITSTETIKIVITIHEVSLVPIPADQNSVGRSMPSYAVRNIYFENTMKDELSHEEQKAIEISEIRARKALLLQMNTLTVIFR